MRMVCALAAACVSYGAAIPPGQVPFRVQAIEDVSSNFPGAPRLQSFSFAQWKGRWVFIGGRTTGYHGVGGGSAEFLRAHANRKIWVVDTTVQPARTYDVDVDRLPGPLAPVRDQWMSTAQLYYQDGSKLYICGGYGIDRSGQWVTFPLVSQADLPSLIDSVVRGEPPASSIRFTETPLVQSSGGELTKLGDGFFYLAMGHVFTGSYADFEAQSEKSAKAASQSYLNEIRKLKITAEGPSGLRVSQVDVFRDAVQFHRRDMNLVHVLAPQGLGFAVYGGVFTPDTNAAYDKPILMFPNSAPSVETSFSQKVNGYNCARMLIYDKTTETMHTTLFGGISAYNWDGAQFVENPRVGARNQPAYRDGLEWSDQISTVSRTMPAGRDSTRETVHSTPLPSALGTGAVFIPAPGIALAAGAPDILDFTRLRGARVFAGYLYGGIQAFPYRFPYTKNGQRYDFGTAPTKTSEAILKVYVDAQ